MDWYALGKKCIVSAIDSLRNLTSIKVIKDRTNIQTDADLVSQNIIKEILTNSGVSCTLISEEKKGVIEINGGDQNVKVVIDPIDYSHLFLRGELPFCSVGLIILINNVPHFSFVGDISNKDIYSCDEENAYKNDKTLRVPNKIPGKKILVAWAPSEPRFREFSEKLRPLLEKEYLLYNYGGMLQGAKIADGKYDACVELISTPMHEFAAVPIVEKAGGFSCTLDGSPLQWSTAKKQTLILCRTREIQKEILDCVRGVSK